MLARLEIPRRAQTLYVDGVTVAKDTQDGPESFPEQLLVPPIRDNIHRVVAMQIDAAE